MTRKSEFVGGSSHGMMAKVVDCGIKVSEFKLKSNYYVHFQTNTFSQRY